MKGFAAVLLAVCLAAAPALAEKADFGEIAGTWYTEEISMDITDKGRFIVKMFRAISDVFETDKRLVEP